MPTNPQNHFDIEAVLKGEQCYEIADDILVRQIENEAILLHISTGTYLSLSETSIPFWEALQNRQPLESAIDRILNEYDVEKSQVVSELAVFMEDLLKLNLIRHRADDRKNKLKTNSDP